MTQLAFTFEEAEARKYLAVDVCDTQSKAAHRIRLFEKYAGDGWYYFQAERKPPLGAGTDHAIYTCKKVA